MTLSGSEGEIPEIISTGQRATDQGATFGFGLTPALSRQRERGKGRAYIFIVCG